MCKRELEVLLGPELASQSEPQPEPQPQMIGQAFDASPFQGDVETGGNPFSDRDLSQEATHQAAPPVMLTDQGCANDLEPWDIGQGHVDILDIETPSVLRVRRLARDVKHAMIAPSLGSTGAAEEPIPPMQ